MSFKASARESGNVTVIDISGPLTLSEGYALREMLRDLLDKGRKRFLLNLDEVSYLDSSGIGELVRGYTTIKKSGGELKVLHLSKRVEELLRMVNLCAVIEDYSDEQTAIRSFL